MKLIVGLGNPGPQYAGTRHNVGFRVLDRLAHGLNARFSKEKYGGLVAEAQLKGDLVLLLKPLTYMNNSGQSVRRAVRYRLDNLADLLVVADDVNLPLGKLRLRRGGSAGGHNGLKSIEQSLGSSEFPRLRIGIGGGETGADLTGYVLGRFTPEEEQEIDRMTARAADAALRFAEVGIEQTMNEFN